MVKNAPANAREAKELVFDPWIGNTPCRRKWQLIPVFWSGKSHGRGACWATVHGVAKGGTGLSKHTPMNTGPSCQIPFDLLMSIFIPLPGE